MLRAWRGMSFPRSPVNPALNRLAGAGPQVVTPWDMHVSKKGVVVPHKGQRRARGSCENFGPARLDRPVRACSATGQVGGRRLQNRYARRASVTMRTSSDSVLTCIFIMTLAR